LGLDSRKDVQDCSDRLFLTLRPLRALAVVKFTVIAGLAGEKDHLEG